MTTHDTGRDAAAEGTVTVTEAGSGTYTQQILLGQHRPLKEVRVTLQHSRIHAENCAHCETTKGWIDHIDRDVVLTGDLDDDQRQRLRQIADRCPVHQTLTSEVDIATTLR